MPADNNDTGNRRRSQSRSRQANNADWGVNAADLPVSPAAQYMAEMYARNPNRMAYDLGVAVENIFFILLTNVHRNHIKICCEYIFHIVEN